ncbi:MAG: hypothetical protein QM784_19430 [Polyangiaceae bacterium]
MKSKGQRHRNWRLSAVLAVFGLISCTVAFDLSSMSAGCGDGQKDCNGDCVPNNDPLKGCAAKDCNPCDVPEHGYSRCSKNGQCESGHDTCFAPWKDCNNDGGDGCEVNTATDINHCSDCNRPACDGGIAPAHADAACIGDSDAAEHCAIASCTRGWADCNRKVGDGCEVDLKTSDSDCGTCGNACDEQQRCVDGICQ